MWVEALDLVLGELRARRRRPLAPSAASAAPGSSTARSTWRAPLDEAGQWSASEPLVDQVRPLLSRATAPIWMDASTGAECAEIAAAAGGNDKMVALTGSRRDRTLHRPADPQVLEGGPRRATSDTAEIHLVSSFVASLLAGASAAIDFGDGAGMNLLDLAARRLEPGAAGRDRPRPGAQAQAGRRRARPRSASSPTTSSSATASRPDTPVIAFTGDNPSSLVGMGATEPGTAVVSLGTSDTMFAAMAAPRTDPRGYGNVFGNPAGGFMALCCFSNGSLAREEIAQPLQPDLGRLRPRHPGADAARQPRQPAAPLLRPRDHPAPARPGAALVRDARLRRRQGRPRPPPAPWSRRRRCRCACTPPSSATSRSASWSRAARRRTPASCACSPTCSRPRSCRCAVSNSSALGGALRAAQAVEGRDWKDLFARFAAPDLDRRVAPDRGTKVIYEGLGQQLQERLTRPGGRNHRKEIGKTHVQARLPRHRAHPLPTRRAAERAGVPLLRQGQEGPRQAHGRPPAHGRLLLAHVRVERLRRVRRRHVRAPVAPRRRRGRAGQGEGRGRVRAVQQAGRAVLLLPRPRRRARGQARWPRPTTSSTGSPTCSKRR